MASCARLGPTHRRRCARHAAGDALVQERLGGHLKIAAIPTALAMVAALTTPYRAHHPEVSFSILMRSDGNRPLPR